MRELLKDNGIGRPSTRANIIETLFRRRYIERNRKNIVATQMGIDLIQIIDNETLKSPQLTGDWERKLRLIEKGEFQPEQFKKELIEMVVGITNEVLFNKTDKTITLVQEKKEQAKLIKGKKAFGCGNYKNGCKFVLPFEFIGKKLTNKQLSDLIEKGKTTVIKGFQVPGSEEKQNGKLEMTEDFNITLNQN
jgi:DNA topoisomerase-3